jgi:hypothetical protein
VVDGGCDRIRLGHQWLLDGAVGVIVGPSLCASTFGGVLRRDRNARLVR